MILCKTNVIINGVYKEMSGNIFMGIPVQWDEVLQWHSGHY